MKAIVITSGGMDSTAALYAAVQQFGVTEVAAISFDYGQRHKKELEHAGRICDSLLMQHRIIDITSINGLMDGSALTRQDIDVPEGHYEEKSMQVTVVPNRNMIMASIAAAWAVAEGAETIVMGMHAGDHAIYPDCRPEFVDALSGTIYLGNEGNPTFAGRLFNVWAPFIDRTKADIVGIGTQMQVPWEKTWTCYNGGEIHCGRCSTCVERLEAFDIAGIQDPTLYADRDYYRTVIEGA